MGRMTENFVNSPRRNSIHTLGIEVDARKNRDLQGGGEIQSNRSRSKVLVVNTQEELSLACQSLELCGHIPKGSGLGDAPFKVRSRPNRRFTLEAGDRTPDMMRNFWRFRVPTV